MKTIMGIKEISELLPQRYPFLLIDGVLEYDSGKYLKALKNVTVNEEFFNGHFPGTPVMPGVLIIEAMGQAGMIFLALENKGKNRRSRMGEFYMSSVKARFKKPVVPGDRLIFEVKPVKLTEKAGIIDVEAKVDGEVVAVSTLAGSKGA